MAAVKASSFGGAGSSSDLHASQLAAIRTTPWWRYGDRDQRLLGLKIRMAREWCVYAADDPAILADLANDSTGILSLTRRRELLNSITAGDWSNAWRAVTLSDLLFLADRYLERYPRSPWNSPVDAALRRAGQLSDGSSLRLLGSIPETLYGCNHPDLIAFAPYEEYERHLFPTRIAERTAEMKLYLSNTLDRFALPAALMPSLSEGVAKRVFSSMQMSDPRDWSSAIQAFSVIDGKIIGAVLEANK